MGLIKDVLLIIILYLVMLEGQCILVVQLQEGEWLGGFLVCVVFDYFSDLWEVCINGVVVLYEVMDCVCLKDGMVIEV